MSGSRSALGVVLENSRKRPGGPGGSQQKQPSAYDKALKDALPVIEAARKLATVSPKAAPSLKAMEDAFDDAARADGKGDAATASTALQQAVTQANAATAAGRQDLLDRHARAVTKLGDRPTRIAALTAPPAPVTQALKTATDARDGAKAEIDGKAPDWEKAGSLLRDLDRAIDGIDTVTLDQATQRSAAFAQRYKDVDKDKPSGTAVIRAYAGHAAARKTLDARIKAGEGLGALEACAGMEAAVAAFEAAGNTTDAAKQQRIQAAYATVSGLSDRALGKKSTREKAELALELCAAGTPKDRDQLKQLSRIYRKSPPDKQFLDKREAQRAAIVDEVSKMPEIAGLFDKKGKLDKAAWKNFTQNPDAVRDLLQKVCDSQIKALGIPKLPVVKDPDPPEPADADGSLSFGGYDPDNNQISLNLHPDALNPIDEALTTILHETFHAQQDVIVKKLKAGDIAPTDPDYPTALMYMVNDIGVGYLQPNVVGQKDYAAQPTEIDAEFQGKLAAQGVLKQVKKNAKSKGGK